MSGVKRSLFHVLAGMSLLLCLAATALWVQSFLYPCFIERNSSSSDVIFWSAHGGVTALYTRFPRTSQMPVGWHFELGPKNDNFLYSVTKPVRWHNPNTCQFYYWPLWVVSVIAGVRFQFAGRKRNPPGHCTVCGYDLRATPQRCPECGTVPPAKQM